LSLGAAASIKQACLQQTPKANLTDFDKCLEQCQAEDYGSIQVLAGTCDGSVGEADLEAF